MDILPNDIPHAVSRPDAGRDRRVDELDTCDWWHRGCSARRLSVGQVRRLLGGESFIATLAHRLGAAREPKLTIATQIRD